MLIENYALLAFLSFGIVNGVISSLIILYQNKNQVFLVGVALSIFFFSLSGLKDFFNHFGYKINFRPEFLITYFQFILFVPVIIIVTYYKKFEKKIKGFYFLIFFALQPFLGVLLLKTKILPLDGFFNANATVIYDTLGVLLFTLFIYLEKDNVKKNKKDFRIIFLFYLAFVFAFLYGWTTTYTVMFHKFFWYKYYMNFFSTSIFIDGLFIYIISFVSLFYANKRRKKNNEFIKKDILDLDILNTIKNKKLFLDKSLSIEKTAVLLETDSKTLSYVIKEKENSSYNEFINSLRITYFVESLKNADLKKLTIYALAEEAGFNSKSTFNRTFKEKFNCTPSQYIRKHLNSTQKEVSK